MIHFQDCVSSIVVTMIEGNSNIDEPHQEENMKCEGLSRLVSLFTESELHTLVSFFFSFCLYLVITFF